MNIFLIARQAKPEVIEKAKTELVAIQALYPSLDSATMITSQGFGGTFYGCVSHAQNISLPRRYIHVDQNTTVFFDGSLVDIQDEFAAHDAEKLSENWDQLSQRLEGQFAVVRMNLDLGTVEVMTDPMGTYQVYYLQKGRSWLISNCMHLLRRVSGENELDPDGISLFLATSGFGKDFTALKRIKVIPGGQIWTWDRMVSEPERREYCRAADFIYHKKKTFSESELLDLVDSLAMPLEILARNFGTLDAPITAGKDSRLITALLMHRQVPADYFSAGVPNQHDVRIGAMIAGRFALPHKVKSHDSAMLSRDWDSLVRKFVAQTDGSVSLAHIANILDQSTTIDRLGVHLYGIGGEYARKSQDGRDFYLHRPSLTYLQDYLFNYMAGKKRRALLKPVVYEHIKKYACDVVKQYWDLGFAPWDIFKARSIFERAPRWSGPNFKQVMMNTDVFSPFCVRAFAKAALQVHALRRYADYLHYKLIKTLNPMLWAVELTAPWKTQSPLLTMTEFLIQPVRTKLAIRSRIRQLVGRQQAGPKGLDPGTRRYYRSAWLQENLGRIRSFCLDNRNSNLWYFVDRKEFEKLTNVNQDEETIRKRHKELYDAYSMFACEIFMKSSVSINPANT